MPESRISSGDLKVTQADLLEKGCQLTKVWSDLFSLLSKYQADLIVKENEIEVLEQQLESKQQVLKSTTDNGTQEITNLKGELQAKDLELAKYRADLLNSEEAMQRLQTEMQSNTDLLTKCRTEVLENQEKFIQARSEIDKLRFELSNKDEQIRIKDALLEKIQAQMMKEVNELSSDVNSLKHQLNLEKAAHEETKRTLVSVSKANKTPEVIDIPDSPPMMNLTSEDNDDLDPESQSTNSSSTKVHLRPSTSSAPRTSTHSQYQFQRTKPNFSGATVSKSQTDSVAHFSTSQTTQSSWTSTPSSAMSRPPPELSDNDIFSALSADSSKDSSNLSTVFKMDDSEPVPVSLTGPVSSELLDDTGQSGGVDSSQLESTDGEGVRRYPGRRCPFCGGTFSSNFTLRRHIRIHTGEKPFSCPVCKKRFNQKYNVRLHMRVHVHR